MAGTIEDERHPFGRVVPALHNRNYRLFAFGQMLSIVGTWMQDVAQAWYVVTKSSSPGVLGAVMAAEFIPILLLAPYGGALADRHDKRTLIALSQVALGLAALALGIVVSANGSLSFVFVLAVARGLFTCVDQPARSAILSQLVPREHLRSAAAFGSLVWNVGRSLGPVLAAVVISGVSIAACFYVNAISYALLLLMVLGMRNDTFRDVVRTPNARVRDAWHHVKKNADVRAGLLSLVFIGTFAYNTATIFPMMARFLFAAQIGAAAQLITAAGIGAIVSGFAMARMGVPTRAQVVASTFVFAIGITLTAVAPTLLTATICAFVWGITNGAYGSTINSFVQLRSAPEFRGRIMAFWTALVFGSSAIGAPLIGLVAELNVRASLGMIAIACFCACVTSLWIFRRHPQHDVGRPG